MNELNNFVVKTLADEKTALDQQIGRLMYAMNSPFTFIEHGEFMKPMKTTRMHSAHSLSSEQWAAEPGATLSRATKTGREDSDGRSNVHNEPVASEGKNYWTETVDTSGNKHTAEIASSVRSTEEWYGVRVAGCVTDNEAMMRLGLTNQSNDITAYGWSAHYMNLFAKDVELTGMKNVVQIVKYF